MTEDRHLPRAAAIEAYGKGGFRFAEMSHRGSLLCLPEGIWPWPVTEPARITEDSLARVFSSGVELFMVGTGKQPWFMPEPLRWRFRDARIGVEVMPTASAVRTYNILFAERRKVGAALIAVD
jgi:uncharacterized protein